MQHHDRNQDSKRITRRNFVPSAGAAVTALTIVPRHVLGAPFVPPSDKLHIAGVGVGAMGGGYLQACESENIVALADVDHEFAAKTFARYPAAKTYRDFRVMLEKEKGVDAVIIGTPDHTHAVVAMAALQMRKHVYCAKPMTRTIYESRMVTRAARDAGVATQMSTQSCASDSACTVEELIQSGAIGAVREVHVWTDRPVWPQGLMRPAETPAVPKPLDWDLWLGPAALRPYHSLYHPFNWRGWYDFGTGALGDMALHTFHVVFRALKLTLPSSVSSSTTVVAEPAPPGQRDPAWSRIRRVKYPESFPHSEIVTWDFTARGDLPPVRLHWYDGGLKPPRPADLGAGPDLPPEGSYYVGTKGVLLVRGSGGGGRRESLLEGLLPASRFADYELPPRTIPRSVGHYKEWIEASKGGPAANCNFEFANLLNETALLGVISARTGKHLEWDAKNARFTNAPEAIEYIHPPYRAGWSLQAG